jgi:hypothetical protein
MDKRSGLIFLMSDREVKKLMGNWGDRFLHSKFLGEKGLS